MGKMSKVRAVFISFFAVFFAIYLIIGFQPADAYENYPISGSLTIPAISLDTDVTVAALDNHQLLVPAQIVGSFSRYEGRTLLIGHASSIFSRLHEVKIGNTIYYNGANYQISSIDTREKTAIDMDELLIPSDDSRDTLILMTCAGTLFNNGDATHRLIVTAERI